MHTAITIPAPASLRGPGRVLCLLSLIDVQESAQRLADDLTCRRAVSLSPSSDRGPQFRVDAQGHHFSRTRARGGPASVALARAWNPDQPDGILQSMPDSTTIKVSARTRDALRELADREGLTFDAQIEKLVRRERRRIIGAQLASAPLDVSDEAVLDASVSDVADASG